MAVSVSRRGFLKALAAVAALPAVAKMLPAVPAEVFEAPAKLPEGDYVFSCYMKPTDGRAIVADAEVIVEEASDGWYRVMTTGPANKIMTQANKVVNDQVKGLGQVNLWGTQLEEGGFATSLIETKAEPVTRPADSLNVMFNPTGTEIDENGREIVTYDFSSEESLQKIGIVERVGANRFHPQHGLLMEESRTNYLRNSTDLTRVTRGLFKTSVARLDEAAWPDSYAVTRLS